jgi:cytochrome c
VLAFLQGYTDAPRGVTVRDGAYYNATVGETRMPPPLADGQAAYEDGAEATRAQMAEDVAVFVAWANRALNAEGAPFITHERGADAGASPDFDLVFGDGVVLAELARRGEAVAAKCTACHSFEEGGPVSVGPNLHDVFGSPVASAPGFQYSEAMLARGGAWDASALYTFVGAPAEAVPGTSMSFAGLRDEAERLAIVAYLKSISAQRAQ